jgi:hypothetical protein
VYNLYHITTWLDKVQRWNMSPYHDLNRHYAVTCGPKEDCQVQKTQWHKMPSSYDLFGDFVMKCHPVDGIGHSLPLMCARNEQILIYTHLKELSVIFKWELRTSRPSPFKSMPALCKVLSSSVAATPVSCTTDSVI